MAVESWIQLSAWIGRHPLAVAWRQSGHGRERKWTVIRHAVTSRAERWRIHTHDAVARVAAARGSDTLRACAVAQRARSICPSRFQLLGIEKAVAASW